MAWVRRGFRRHASREMHAIHHVHPEGPVECGVLKAHTFRSRSFVQIAHVGDYIRWLGGQDMTPVYAWHRRMLQLLQRQQRGERWMLKAPNHMDSLDALLAVYPDARIVQTHRDPAEAMPSTASLMRAMWRRKLCHLDLVTLGRGCVWTWKRILAKAAVVRRDRARPGQFFDVQYRDLVADPIATVRGIYDHFALPWGPQQADPMRRWLAENPQGRFGRHRYSLAEFGLTRDWVHKQFADAQQQAGVV